MGDTLPRLIGDSGILGHFWFPGWNGLYANPEDHRGYTGNTVGNRVWQVWCNRGSGLGEYLHPYLVSNGALYS